LHLSELAADNGFDLRGKVLGQQVGCPANQAAVDQLHHLLQPCSPQLLLIIGSKRVATAQDGRLEPLAELSRRAQELGVDELNEGVVLEELVLDRGAGENDPPLGVEGDESTVGLVLTVLEPVTLVTNTDAKGASDGIGVST
jgi:hypothetical protein